MTIKRRCIVCKTETGKTRRYQCCLPCFIHANPKQLIQKIKDQFSPPGAFNQWIFENCCQDLEKRKSPKTRDALMLARTAQRLSQAPLPEPKSWRDALALSKQLGIRYSLEETASSHLLNPVLRWASPLKLKELSATKPERRKSQMQRQFEDFDPNARPIVRTYLDQCAVHQRSVESRNLSLRRLRNLSRYLRAEPWKSEDFLNPSPRALQAYLASRSGIANTHSLRSQLRRFYLWSQKNGHTQVDPLEGWSLPKISQICAHCLKLRNLNRSDHLCDSCCTNLQFLNRIERLARSFRSPWPYNQHIFDLYIKYVKRHSLSHTHITKSRSFARFLRKRQVPALRSWLAVLEQVHEFEKVQAPKPGGISPFIKVGRMLEELGVLPARQLDKEVAVQRLLENTPEHPWRAILSRYSKKLIQMNCSSVSVHSNLYTIARFQTWLARHEPAFDLFTVTESVALRHLLSLGNRDRNGIRRQALGRFYRWARLEKLILSNPVARIPVPKIAKHICVCSDQQIRRLERYVKSPDSDPEYALILALVLYWGLKSKELALSTMDIHQGQSLWIHLYQAQLSRGRKSRNREQVLKLPLSPPWLAALQKRYIRLWRERYERAKKSFSSQPLILKRSHHGRTTRPLSLGTVIRLFGDATLAATGVRIPPNVVRWTSGHIHVDSRDASRLNRLGWSKTRCLDFSYLPRQYYTPAPKRLRR